jgi:hypothetical protein
MIIPFKSNNQGGIQVFRQQEFKRSLVNPVLRLKKHQPVPVLSPPP